MSDSVMLLVEVSVLLVVCAVVVHRTRVLRQRRGTAHAVLLAVARFSPGGATARQIEEEAERTLGCSLGAGTIWTTLAQHETNGRIAATWAESRYPGGPRRRLYHTLVPVQSPPRRKY